MGTSVTTELMARDLRGELSFEMRGALLFNGSMLLRNAYRNVGYKNVDLRIQKDLVALGVDALHAELSAGDRKCARQSGRESTRHVLDDVGGQDVVEQFPPCGVRLGERGRSSPGG